MKNTLLGLLIGVGAGLLLGEIAIALGAPFVVAHAVLVVCAVAGIELGLRKGAS